MSENKTQTYEAGKTGIITDDKTYHDSIKARTSRIAEAKKYINETQSSFIDKGLEAYFTIRNKKGINYDNNYKFSDEDAKAFEKELKKALCEAEMDINGNNKFLADLEKKGVKKEEIEATRKQLHDIYAKQMIYDSTQVLAQIEQYNGHLTLERAQSLIGEPLQNATMSYQQKARDERPKMHEVGKFVEELNDYRVKNGLTKLEPSTIVTERDIENRLDETADAINKMKYNKKPETIDNKVGYA